MEYIGEGVPDEPYNDFTIATIINMFFHATRCRKYIVGMSAAPLPLSVIEINEVLKAFPVYINRELLYQCIYAIDDYWMSVESSNANTKVKDDNE